jgi:hypothetical protein
MRLISACQHSHRSICGWWFSTTNHGYHRETLDWGLSAGQTLAGRKEQGLSRLVAARSCLAAHGMLTPSCNLEQCSQSDVAKQALYNGSNAPRTASPTVESHTVPVQNRQHKLRPHKLVKQ